MEGSVHCTCGVTRNGPKWIGTLALFSADMVSGVSEDIGKVGMVILIGERWVELGR